MALTPRLFSAENTSKWSVIQTLSVYHPIDPLFHAESFTLSIDLAGSSPLQLPGTLFMVQTQKRVSCSVCADSRVERSAAVERSKGRHEFTDESHHEL